MLFFRSLLCQLAFYVNFFAHALFTPIGLLLPRPWAMAFSAQWATSSIWWWKVTTGSTFEFRGLENVPDGGFILACKHQSTWETLGLFQRISGLVYIMKKELMYIPIFGWFTAKVKMIPVARGKGGAALTEMLEASKEAISAGRRIVIFMEGTRMAPGTTRPYKIGVGKMYQDLNCPIVPVAVNTGLVWPRNGFKRYTGHVIVEVLPVIEPGLSLEEVMTTLEERVETASNRLILESAASENPPATIHKALKALESRGVDISSVAGKAA